MAGSGGTFDLRTTLPAGTPLGGAFAVGTTGLPLPTGMRLSSDGILSIGTATTGAVTGVVFSYTLP